MTSAHQVQSTKLHKQSALALSLTTAIFNNGIVTAWSDDTPADVRITRSGSTITIHDVTNNFVRSYTGAIQRVQIVGGTLPKTA